MRIDKRLNLVVPIEQDGAPTVYVHAAPVSQEVFEQHFLLMSKTFAAIYGEGLGEIAGPRVATLLMRRIAKDTGLDDNGLLSEIQRLANVIAPGQIGTLPLQQALAQGIVAPEDASEVENAITFFTVASSVHRRREAASILDGAAKLWGARTSLLNCTEFAASLPTSTATAVMAKVA